MIGLYRDGSRIFSEGFDLITLPYSSYVFERTRLNKQCRPKPAGSTLFVTYPAILHTIILVGYKMDFLKRCIG